MRTLDPACKYAHMNLVTSAEAAEALDVTVATINRWAAAGTLLPAQKLPGITGAYLFHPAAVRIFRAMRADDVEAITAEAEASA